MMKMYWNFIKAMLGSKKGQGMVEYGLIIGIVAIILIAALGLLSDPLNNLFQSIKDTITNNTPVSSPAPTP